MSRLAVGSSRISLTENRPRDGDFLPLTAGKVGSKLTNLVIQPVVQRSNELVKACQLHRLTDLFVTYRAADAVEQVVTNRTGKKRCLLHHIGDSAAPAPHILLADIIRTTKNASGIRLVDPFQQLDQRSLARSAVTDDSSYFPAGNGKGYILQNRLFVIGEGDMVKLDITVRNDLLHISVTLFN